MTFFCAQAIRWAAGDAQIPAVEREITILQTLRHPRILILMGVCRDLPAAMGTVGLLTELMERGSLYRVLHNTSAEAVAQRPTSHATRLRICADIADGMRFLHESGVLHRDLTSRNVLVDGEGRCKIADFGLSTFRDMTATQTAGVQATPAWTAPEVMTGAARFSAASDVYSFGVICWEVFSGAVPWQDVFHPMVLLNAVGIQGQRLPVPENCPVAVGELLQHCFGVADARPTFRAIYTQLAGWLTEQVGADQQVVAAFLCPISTEVMVDPVICCDGFSYERTNIEQWLAMSDHSPMTNLPLDHLVLVPNHNLRAAIQAWNA
jgi:serine/threonine protein kinase